MRHVKRAPDRRTCSATNAGRTEPSALPTPSRLSYPTRPSAGRPRREASCRRGASQSRSGCPNRHDVARGRRRRRDADGETPRVMDGADPGSRGPRAAVPVSVSPTCRRAIDGPCRAPRLQEFIREARTKAVRHASSSAPDADSDAFVPPRASFPGRFRPLDRLRPRLVSRRPLQDDRVAAASGFGSIPPNADFGTRNGRLERAAAPIFAHDRCRRRAPNLA